MKSKTTYALFAVLLAVAMVAGVNADTYSMSRPADYAELHLSAAATTVLSDSTPTKATGTTTTCTNQDFTVTDNRFTYTGDVATRFFVLASVSIESAEAGSELATIWLAKNGTTDADESKDVTMSDTSVASADVQGVFEFTTNDYVELYVSSSGKDVRLTKFTMTALPVNR